MGAVVSLGAALVLIACDDVDRSPFRVATTSWAGYEILHLAQRIGSLADSPIKLVELQSASDVSLALRNGTVEVAAMTLDEALTVAQDGVELRVIPILDFSAGGDALLGALGRVETLDALVGKRVSVENSAVAAVLLDGALSAANLTLEAVVPVNVSVESHEQVALEGGVDAIVTFEPARSRLLARGFIPLFDSTSIPHRIVDVLVMTRATLEARGHSTRRLIAAHFQALAQLQNNPKTAHTRMAPRLGVALADVASVFEGLAFAGLEENRQLLGDQRGMMTLASDLKGLMLARAMYRVRLDA